MLFLERHARKIININAWLRNTRIFATYKLDIYLNFRARRVLVELIRMSQLFNIKLSCLLNLISKIHLNFTLFRHSICSLFQLFQEPII